MRMRILMRRRTGSSDRAVENGQWGGEGGAGLALDGCIGPAPAREKCPEAVRFVVVEYDRDTVVS